MYKYSLQGDQLHIYNIDSLLNQNTFQLNKIYYSNNSIYLCGLSIDSTKPDTYSMYIAKCDTNINVVWKKYFGEINKYNGQLSLNALVNDTLLALNYVSYDVTEKLYKNRLKFINSDGALITELTIPTDRDSILSKFIKIVQVSDGYLLLGETGNFRKYSSKGFQYFLVKLDKSFHQVWSKTWGEDNIYNCLTDAFEITPGQYQVIGISKYQTYFATIKDNTSDINEKTFDSGLSHKIEVYPNPATNWIKINIDPYSDYIVFDMYGKQIMKDKLDCTKSINIEHLTSGTYKIYFPESNTSTKFVVVR